MLKIASYPSAASLTACFDCDLEIYPTQFPAAGTPVMAPGVKSINVTATDDSGNMGNTFIVTAKVKKASCAAIILFEDLIPPVLECDQTIVLYVNEQCQASVPSLTPNVTENCNSVMFEQTINHSSLLGLGDTLIKVTATDGSGNKALTALYCF